MSTDQILVFFLVWFGILVVSSVMATLYIYTSRYLEYQNKKQESKNK